MDVLLFWILPGIIGTILLNWLLYCVDNITVKQVTISDVLIMIGTSILGMVFGWLTILVFVMMAYDELRLGDIVLWKKKKTKQPKASDADILDDLFKRALDKPSLKQQLIEKLNFDEKTIKGLEE